MADTQIHIRSPYEPDKPFAPLPHQLQFALSPSAETFLGGGWGSAKSAALVLFGMVSSYQYGRPGVPGGFIMPRFDLMRKFLYEHFIPMCGHLIVGQNKQERWYDLVGNRRFYYFSGHDPQFLEALNAGWLGIDEAGLMRSEIFRKAVARIRHPRQIKHRLGVVGVPLWGWLHDMFAGRCDAKRLHMTAKTSDNPYLPDDYEDRLRAAVPPRMIDQYLNGEFVTPGSSVYYMYDPMVHVVDWNWMPTVTDGQGVNRQAAIECGLIIDPSPRKPHVLFVQLLRKGYMLKDDGDDWYKLEHDAMMIYDELYPGTAGEAISAEDLWNKIHAKGWPYSWILVDKAAKGVESTSGKSFAQVSRTITDMSCMMVTNQALTLIRNGVAMVQARLSHTETHPYIYFSKRLQMNQHDRAILRALVLSSYPEDKDGKPTAQEPIKDGVVDHAMDCLRYGVVHFFPVHHLIGQVWDSERPHKT